MDALLFWPLLDLIILLLIHLFKVSINFRLKHLEILHLLLYPVLIFLCCGGSCLRSNDLFSTHHDIFEYLLLMSTDCCLVLSAMTGDWSRCRLEDSHVCTRGCWSRSVLLIVFIRVLHLIMDWCLNYCNARLWLFLGFR
jgi:hypothetical protein